MHQFPVFGKQEFKGKQRDIMNAAIDGEDQRAPKSDCYSETKLSVPHQAWMFSPLHPPGWAR